MTKGDDSAVFFIRPSNTNESLYGISFTDPNTGTAVGGDGTILRTTDSGATWVSQTVVTKNTLWGVSFTDATTGTVVGNYGTILGTTSCGKD